MIFLLDTNVLSAVMASRPPVEVALVALSVSPVPPFLPDKMLRLTLHQGYVYGLLVVRGEQPSPMHANQPWYPTVILPTTSPGELAAAAPDASAL